jgi:fumarate reductase flavoprotein subunit
VGILRTKEGIEQGIASIAQHHDALRSIGVADGQRRFNLSWHDWLNLESLTTISKVIATAALARSDSRGAHFREDYPETGNLDTTAYTSISGSEDNIELQMVPVKFDIVSPGNTLIGQEAEKCA